MKVTYEFFKSLQSLLSNSNWQEPLKNRLTQINDELIGLQNVNNNKAARILEKIRTTISEKTREITTEQYNNFIKISVPKSEQNLLNEKKEIENCLANNSYKLGIALFEKIEYAKFLLGNVDIFQLDIFNESNT